MTTTDLETQLSEAEAKLEEARQAAGAALLDGTGDKGVRKGVQDALADVEMIRAAIQETNRRAEQAAREARAQQEARMRWRYVSWHLEYAKRIKPVIELRAKLAAAEAHAMALGDILDAAPGEQAWLSRERDAGRIPEFTAIPNRVPIGENERVQRSVRADTADLSPADCDRLVREIAPKAAELAESVAEEARTLPWAEGV